MPIARADRRPPARPARHARLGGAHRRRGVRAHGRRLRADPVGPPAAAAAHAVAGQPHRVEHGRRIDRVERDRHERLRAAAARPRRRARRPRGAHPERRDVHACSPTTASTTATAAATPTACGRRTSTVTAGSRTPAAWWATRRCSRSRPTTGSASCCCRTVAATKRGVAAAAFAAVRASLAGAELPDGVGAARADRDPEGRGLRRSLRGRRRPRPRGRGGRRRPARRDRSARRAPRARSARRRGRRRLPGRARGARPVPAASSSATTTGAWSRRSTGRRGSVASAYAGREPAAAAPGAGRGYPGFYRNDSPWNPVLAGARPQGRARARSGRTRAATRARGRLIAARRRVVRGGGRARPAAGAVRGRHDRRRAHGRRACSTAAAGSARSRRTPGSG